MADKKILIDPVAKKQIDLRNLARLLLEITAEQKPCTTSDPDTVNGFGADFVDID